MQNKIIFCPGERPLGWSTRALRKPTSRKSTLPDLPFPAGLAHRSTTVPVPEWNVGARSLLPASFAIRTELSDQNPRFEPENSRFEVKRSQTFQISTFSMKFSLFLDSLEALSHVYSSFSVISDAFWRSRASQITFGIFK